MLLGVFIFSQWFSGHAIDQGTSFQGRKQVLLSVLYSAILELKIFVYACMCVCVWEGCSFCRGMFT